jgi:hypothetical protein
MYTHCSDPYGCEDGFGTHLIYQACLLKFNYNVAYGDHIPQIDVTATLTTTLGSGEAFGSR